MNDYEQAKQVVENPYSYHELDVRDAKAFIRGYEAALRQPLVSGECEHPWASVIGDGESQPAKCLKCGKIL